MQEQPIKGNISLYDPSMEPWDQGQSKFLFKLNVEIDFLSYIVRQIVMSQFQAYNIFYCIEKLT